VSVSSTVVMAPAAVLGPPDLMFAFATLTGDASGGTNQINFIIPAGFLWMINFVSFGGSGPAAFEFALHLSNQDDTVAVNSITVSHVATLPANATLSAAESYIWPRYLFKTTTRAANLALQTPNTDTRVNRLYVRMLRWPKNAAPEAWAAFLVAPS